MIINGEENITGLVLKNKPYKENDMLLWIYTHDYGKLALIAKGVKKLKIKMPLLVKLSLCQNLLLFLEVVYQI